jgi:hypothetical protein
MDRGIILSVSFQFPVARPGKEIKFHKLVFFACAVSGLGGYPETGAVIVYPGNGGHIYAASTKYKNRQESQQTIKKTFHGKALRYLSIAAAALFPAPIAAITVPSPMVISPPANTPFIDVM